MNIPRILDCSLTIFNMKPMMTCLVMLLLITDYTVTEKCEREPKDEKIYTFLTRESDPPDSYSFITKDGKAAGIFVDIVKLICDIMNKKCVHTFQSVTYCWDNKNFSRALNDRWVDVCLGYLTTATRKSVNAFVGEMTKEPAISIFVKKGLNSRTVKDIKNMDMGFTKELWMTPGCIESQLGITLTGKMTTDFPSQQDMFDALGNGQIEAMVALSELVGDDLQFERIVTDPISCALGGLSMMVRKDMAHELAWIDEGLQKLKKNGDYAWMRSKAKQVGPFKNIW